METTTATELQIHEAEIKKAVMLFRAINHKLRQTILRLIHHSGKMTVTEIYRQLELEQSVASQHLAILRKAGFVSTQRDRRCIYYSVNYQTLHHLEEQSRKLLSQL